MASAQRSTIRLASFNIRRGTDASGRVRLNELRRACEALDADVLGLQEVERGRWSSRLIDQAAYIARRQRYAHVFASARPGRWLRGYGNALLARGKIRDVDIRTLPRLSDRQQRVGLLACVEIEAGSLSVAVTHLQHYPARFHHLPDEAPEQLDALLDWLLERPRPRVLLGDLNLTPRRVQSVLADAGLTLATTGPASPADLPSREIDYIAVDGVSVESSWVANAAPVSDHRPIVAEVRFPNRSTGD
jgi:endonuclease/exonuclease/phosphatase family metal-dependent hydrolase